MIYLFLYLQNKIIIIYNKNKIMAKEIIQEKLKHLNIYEYIDKKTSEGLTKEDIIYKLAKMIEISTSNFYRKLAHGKLSKGEKLIIFTEINEIKINKAFNSFFDKN